MENNQLFNIRDNWEKKYIKDSVWFPFGTLVNGWALIKKNDPNYTLDNFNKDIQTLHQMALKLVKDTYDKCEEAEVKKNTSSFDIPIKSE